MRTIAFVTGLLFTGLALGEDEKEKGKAGAEAKPSERVQGWLEAMDGNKDGRLAKDETQGPMQRNFGRIDGNQDGILDKKELAALDKRLGGQGQGANRRPGNQAQGMSSEQLLRTAPANVVVHPDLRYREGKSKRWTLDLIEPKAKSETPRPGLVFVHGGGWRSGDKRRGTFLNNAIAYAQSGYVCITVNYRLVNEAPFPACVEDVKNAVRWFRANAEKYNLDPERIGAYGNSAGAHLVCMLGLVGKEAGLEGDGPHRDQSSLVQAVCASAAPTDFLLFGGSYERMGREGGLLAGPAEGLEVRGKAASPVTHVRKDAPPFLLIHGTVDGTVNVKHSDVFAEALKKTGAKDVTYLRIEGAGHGVFTQHKDRTGPAMEAFFARTLGQGDSAQKRDRDASR